MNGNIQIGTLLGGRYEILEKIGTGGMADVYKARCQLLKRLVAIKVLKPEFSDDDDFVRRFAVEAQAAASFSHNNIVSVYDVGSSDGVNYIIMELAEGITLKEYITEKGALKWREAAKIAAKICAALECAHKNGIVHRDIKPHNIIITNDGEAKVTDFGIARAATGSTTVADKSVIGSAHYFSPEQARGGYTDAKSDIYSTGVTLYEMLTGRVPFDADSAVSVAMMHMAEQAVSPRIINPDVTEDMEKIVMKAMSKEQNLRYQSAGEMLADLEAVLTDMPLGFGEEIEILKADDEEMRSRARRSKSSRRKSVKKARNNAPLTKSEKRLAGFAIAAGVALLGVVLLGFLLLFGGFGSSQGDETVVPSIEGKTLAEAKDMLKKAKLDFHIDEEIASVQFAKDTIISQDPVAERRVKKGAKVHVKVSTGADGQVVVPNVANYEKMNAKETLEKLGFVVAFTEEQSENIAVGTVIRQSPDFGVGAKLGDTIRLYISANLDKVDVPSVVGKSLAQAKNDIEAVGLVVGNVTEQESNQDVGTVIRQSPESGEKADKKSAVALTVSKGSGSSNSDETAFKMKTISLPVPQSKESTRIRVVANGKQIHDAVHNKSEISFDIPVKGKSSATLEIYHDGALVGKQTITFN